MVDEYIRIQRIEALVTAINPGQCCIEPSDDTDLGYRMFCYKDLSSTPLSYKLLAKGKPGLLSSLVLSDLAGSEIGIVRHTTTGLLIGGLMTVDQLNSYLSDGPLIKDCVTSLVKDGELELQGDLVLYEGSNVTITQEVDGFTIASTGSSGGSLDDAYDYGGSGLGRTITADSGSVRFVVPDAANNAALDLSNSDVTNHPNTLQITRNTIPTSVPSDSFSIFLTGSANQSIFSDQVLYVGAVEESSYSYAYTKYHFDPTNGGALQLYARRQGAGGGPHRHHGPLHGADRFRGLRGAQRPRPAPPDPPGARRAHGRRAHPRHRAEDPDPRRGRLGPAQPKPEPNAMPVPNQDAIQAEIAKEITENKIVIYGKGTKEMPMCGFTVETIQFFNKYGHPFTVINVLDNPAKRQVLAEMTEWPTLPKVFIGGEFYADTDVLDEMESKGEVKPLLDKVFGAA